MFLMLRGRNRNASALTEDFANGIGLFVPLLPGDHLSQQADGHELNAYDDEEKSDEKQGTIAEGR